MRESFLYVIYHRRIHRGWGSGPPEIWPGVRGVHVPVNYHQAPLIKQVLYLYCMMDTDTAENVNVWHSLACGRETISDNGRHWRPLTFQWLTVAVSTVNCYRQQFKLMLRAGYGGCSRGRQADVAVCCPLLAYHKQDSVMTVIRHLMTAAAVA